MADQRTRPLTTPRIAVVVKGYPRLSETFIAQEILGLEGRGLDLVIVSLRHPTDPAVHGLNRAIRAPVRYLPEYLHQEPRRVLRAWWRVRRWPAYARVRAGWLADLRRDPSRNRIRRFGQALVLADELGADVGLLYVHYLHTPASVGRYAAQLAGRNWCVSAHAKDIWTTPAWEKRQKLADCRWLTTCTEANATHLRALAPDADVALTYHGLDRNRFAPIARPLGPDGRDPEHPVTLLGVARLVEKKGLDVLFQALATLPPELHWRYQHIGGGPLAKRLAALAVDLGLADRVSWQGARTQDQVFEAYRQADLFVLACRVAADGDRDGLPNVVLEAASQGLPVVSTRLSGLPELIEDRISGRLVPPDDPAALAAAIADLIAAPATRQRLGEAAQATVATRFDMDAGLDRLAARLRADLAGAALAAA